MTQHDIERLGLPPGLEDLIQKRVRRNSLEKLSLPAFLFYYSLQQFDRSRRYTKNYVEFGQLQTVIGQLYQCGSTLGHLQPERGRDMMRFSMGEGQGSPNETFATSKRQAQRRVEVYRRATGQLPESVDVMLYTTGFIEQGVNSLLDVKGVRETAYKRILLTDAVASAPPTFNEGVAFAITQPTLWRKAMVAHDQAHRELSSITDDQLLDMGDLRTMTVELCRTWAQLCRPDLLPLIPDTGVVQRNGRVAA